MSIRREHVAAIENFGYGSTEAAFLYLVATHSGYFTRNQFLRYTGLKKGCLVHRLTSRTIDLKQAIAKEYRRTLIYHLFSRQIYGAIDKDNLRNRRDLSKDLVRTRLLILDFIISRPEYEYLETESEKVHYFHNEGGIPLTAFPSRTYKSPKSGSQTVRYFVDRFPIYLGGNCSVAPTFVYCDSGLPGLFSFATYLRNHQELFRRFPNFKLIYASPTSSKNAYARRLFDRMFAAAGEDSTEILRYFRIRRLWEGRQTESLTRVDRDHLRDGDRKFQGQVFDQLFHQWAIGAISDDDLTNQFGTIQAKPVAHFETYRLPENYGVFLQINSAPIRPSTEFTRSSVRSTSEPSNVQAKYMKEQDF
jgi:hypothetical protein